MVRLWRKPTPSKSPQGETFLFLTPPLGRVGERSLFFLPSHVGEGSAYVVNQPPPLGRDGEGSIHTTCHAEASSNCREHGDDGLHDKLPSFNFVFHSIIRLIWLFLKAYGLYGFYRLDF